MHTRQPPQTTRTRAACACLGAWLLLGVAVIPAASAQSAPQFTLKLHHQLGPQSPAHTRMLVPWAQRIEQASNGRVKIDIYPSLSLGGKPQELYGQIRDGVVDLGWMPNGYNPGQFPRSEVFELPFVHTNDPAATNLALRDLYEPLLKDDYREVHLLFNHVHAGWGFHMAERPVRSIADLQGAKIRVPSRTGVWIIEALGANPVGMPLPGLPQALASKVVDGAMIPWEIIPALKLQELTRYQIEGADKTRFGTVVFQVSMNQGTWDRLPADLQRIFTANSDRAWLREVGALWAATDDDGIALAVASGNEHITLSPQQTETFRQRLEPVVTRWISEVAAEGIDGATLVKAAREKVRANTPARKP
jgi:TRAP-type C4-dicarboxylate transport system substrate-binding protein